MQTISGTTKECQCFDCSKDAPLPSLLLERFRIAQPEERNEIMSHIYYSKPVSKTSNTKVWYSTTQMEYPARPDLWTSKVPEYLPSKQFQNSVCRKWCDGEHNPPLLCE
ncbi:uncharacterized protein CDAR_465891 [Caerostris darwini]|uniref:Uncharacterized protein n=1 Tax=Caerostris darwini TaxID=1538125 RepID=A0AAV4RRD4_9ARAC|nr:uncharacterized protein CDAR_465891 [Caerostris darwini]